MNTINSQINRLPRKSPDSIKEICDSLKDVFNENDKIYYQEFFLIEGRISDFKLRVPLVGFSGSGKSSLINAVINERLLPADVESKTYFTTEIEYGDIKKITAIDLVSNKSLEISEDDFQAKGLKNILDAKFLNKEPAQAEAVVGGGTDNNKNTQSTEKPNALSPDYYIKISHPSDNLKKLRQTCLLDIPGISSSNSEHDRIIKRNIKEAVAYIIVVSAEEGTIRSSLRMIIKELAANEIPFGLVVTKADKREASEVKKITDSLKKELYGSLKQQPLFITASSARKQEIGSFVNKIEYLDDLADYLLQRKIISPLCLKLSEINRNIKCNLERSSLTLKDIETEIQGLSNTIATTKNIVEPAIAEFQNRVTQNIDRFVEIILDEVKNSKKILTQVIVEKSKEAKEEVENIIKTSIRIGLQTATKEIIERPYYELCNQVGGAILNKREEIKIGDSWFDIEYDEYGSTEISLSEAALLGGIGGLLLATVFPLLGIAISAISFAASWFFNKKENQEGGDKKTAEAKAQVDQFFKKLKDDLKDKAPGIIQSKVQAIKEKIEGELDRKLKNLYEQYVTIKKLKEDSNLDEEVSRWEKQHEKVSYALSKICHLYAPDQANIFLNNKIYINITPKSPLPKEIDETQDISCISPVFDKIFFIWLDTSPQELSPSFKIKFPCLIHYPFATNDLSANEFKLGVETRTQKNLFQHKSLFTPKEIDVIKQGFSFLFIKSNRSTLNNLLAISKKFNSSIRNDATTSSPKGKNLHEQYEYLLQEIFNAKMENFTAIEQNGIPAEQFKLLEKRYRYLLEKLISLSTKNIQISTSFGTKKLFETIQDDVKNFDDAMEKILSGIASILIKNGLSIVCKKEADTSLPNNILEEISSVENLYNLFHANMLSKSENAKSIFNKKETLLLRRKLIEQTIDKNTRKYMETIEKIKQLMCIEPSIAVLYKDRKKIYQIK